MDIVLGKREEDEKKVKARQFLLLYLKRSLGESEFSRSVAAFEEASSSSSKVVAAALPVSREETAYGHRWEITPVGKCSRRKANKPSM
ncbi:hypothetical protein L2E82_12506 [Cichorium intybus]|uniref:Uncharacterized protein n=1 Tax=Cichorium intybus TaxID=13427 RepID=A0ACB9GG12_CICIN|nr:hypothetical protein L2E82_12506 [Cichorium intybus]